MLGLIWLPMPQEATPPTTTCAFLSPTTYLPTHILVTPAHSATACPSLVALHPHHESLWLSLARSCPFRRPLAPLLPRSLLPSLPPTHHRTYVAPRLVRNGVLTVGHLLRDHAGVKSNFAQLMVKPWIPVNQNVLSSLKTTRFSGWSLVPMRFPLLANTACVSYSQSYLAFAE